jgi:beta-glucosidase
MADGGLETPSFPAGFLWGATTGSHQTEGNNIASNWWALENSPGSIIAEPSGDAVDSYHRWREDMDLLADAGLTDYRFGIEWSRIEPADGRVSRASVQHYRRMAEYAISLGIRPMPTLFHFTVPQWFQSSGGWARPDAVDRFLRYADALAPVLDTGVQRVETVNEPNIVAAIPLIAAAGGDLSAGMPEPDAALSARMLELHDAVRDRLKRNHPHILTGWGVSVQDYQALPGAEDLLEQYARPRDEVFLEASRGDDWVGIQTYTRRLIAAVDGRPVARQPTGAPLTQTGWEYYPAALGGAVRRVARIVGDVPIIVTENGVATADDEARIAFTAHALRSLGEAMDSGIDVRGYLHWSLLDNYEWGHWEPAFGLVAVDRVTFERHPKPSLAWLGSRAPAHAPADVKEHG